MQIWVYQTLLKEHLTTSQPAASDGVDAKTGTQGCPWAKVKTILLTVHVCLSLIYSPLVYPTFNIIIKPFLEPANLQVDEL